MNTLPIDTAPRIGAQPSATALFDDFSLEMTGKDLDHLPEARAAIPVGTRINITYLAGEDLSARLAAAAAVEQLGFVPVPHLSARRLHSEGELEEFLAALREIGASQRLFVVGGDPPRPEGPYEDSASVIASGLLQHYGVSDVSVAGYPEGHPDIEAPVLWAALETKLALLEAQGLTSGVIAQFGFDAEAVLRWVAEVRARGIAVPIRVGVPGPAGVKRLLSYAKRCGVGTGVVIARKYGLSLSNLMSTAGPERFLGELAKGYDPQTHGALGLHFYTFGGLRATAEWVGDFRKEAL